MTAKRLPIPTCQRVLAAERRGPGVVPFKGPRLCGSPAVAVYRYGDGRELFVCLPCDLELVAQADQGPQWQLHRRTA